MAERVAGAAAPADDRLTVINAFAGAVGRESHVLHERPELLWQQVYNRLQWKAPPMADLLMGGRHRPARSNARGSRNAPGL